MVGSIGASNPETGDDGYRRVATFRFRYADARWEWSPEAAVLHGYAPGEVTPTTELLAAHKHPDDRESFLALVEDMRTRHTPFSSRHRIMDVQGGMHPVAVIAHTFRDDTGEVAGTEGFYLDLAEYATETVVAEVDDHIKAFRENSAVIEQAKGMIMIVYGVNAQRAFDVLKWRSQTENTKLRAICEAIVAEAAQVQFTEPIRHQFDHVVLSARTSPRP